MTWTDPTGRRWLSVAQHQPPVPAVRPLPPVAGPHPLDELDPYELDEELELLGLLPADPDGLELRSPERVPPVGRDLVRKHLLHGDTPWTLDLDDPYGWVEQLR